MVPPINQGPEEIFADLIADWMIIYVLRTSLRHNSSLAHGIEEDTEWKGTIDLWAEGSVAN